MAFELSLESGMNECAGLEVNIRTDGTFAVRLVELSLQKKLIHIKEKKEQVVAADQLHSVKVKGPLAVTLTGKGVLIKKTKRLESITAQSLSQLFPDFKMADFYVQHFPAGDNSFIAFVRKEIADHILSIFKKQGAELLMLSLGPFAAEQAIPQLNNYNGNLNFDGHQIVLDDQKTWLDYNYAAGLDSSFELKIDTEPLPQQFLLAYATAFQLILHERLELIRVEADDINTQLVESTFRLKFNRNASLLLLVFFVLLLVNFLLFSFYNSANQALAGKAGARSDVSQNKEKLQAEVKEKEAQVKLLGWNNGQNYAYLCDQIGQTLPAAIILNELVINPLQQGSSSSQKIIETGSMRITGQSANIYVINDWIYALKLKPWVKAVQLEKYGRDDQKEIQVFTLLLNY